MYKHINNCGNISNMITFYLKKTSKFKYKVMKCHSTSVKSHQLKLSVSRITTSIVEEISERCCLTDVCVICLTDQQKQLQKSQEFLVKRLWCLSGNSKNRYIQITLWQVTF